LGPGRLFRPCRGGKAAVAHLVAGGGGAVLPRAAAADVRADARRARKPHRATGRARPPDARILCARRLADAHRALDRRLLHEPAAGLGIFGRRHRRARGLSRAASRLDAANGAGHRAGDARNPDFLAAAGTGISRRQCLAALPWGVAFHLERHRRAVRETRAALAALNHKLLRANFLFALSLALAAVHLRTLLETKPRA